MKQSDEFKPTKPFDDPTPLEQSVYQSGYLSARRAVENKLLADQLEHDELTGLLKKKAFLNKANERLKQLPPGQAAIIFIDLENFKAVNDKHPQKYEKGDKVLVDLAGYLKTITRQGEPFYDLLTRGSRQDQDNEASRLGGDEIAVFGELTGREDREVNMSPEERLDAFINRLQTDYNNYLDKNPDLKALGLNISIGGVIQQEGETAEQMLARASHEMADNKELHQSQNGSYR